MSVYAEERFKVTLLMNVASDPVDIIWENMGGIRGVYFFR